MVNENESANQSGHDSDESEYLSENCCPANRPIIRTAVFAVGLGHGNDTLTETWNDAIVLREFFGLG